MKNNTNTEEKTTTPDSFVDYEIIFKEELKNVKAFERDEYYTPPMRIDVYLKEAEGVYEVLTRRFDRLAKDGFKKAYAEKYYRAIAVARIAHANMNTDTEEALSDKLTWKELYPEAKALRERLMDRIIFVTSDNERLSAIAKSISSGQKISDIIQDLLELGKMGESVFEALKEMNVSRDELKRSIELGTILGRIHEASRLDGIANSESRVIRDKAITLLHIELTHIRKWANLVYKHDYSVRKQFFSKYLRQRNAAVRQTAQEKEAAFQEAMNIEPVIEDEEASDAA
ncbi:MAG: hypothetical protein OCD01_17830 [Fibrobacterales bacterium]